MTIILDARDAKDVKKLVEDVKNSYCYSNVELLIISADENLSGNYVIKPENNCFKQYNEMIENLDSDYFVIMDEQFVAIKNLEWIQDLVGIVQNEDVGIVGTKLYNQEGKIEHCGIILGMNGMGDFLYKGVPKDMPTYMQRLKIIHNVTSAYYKYAMIDKKLFQKIGMFQLEFTGLLTSLDVCLSMLEKSKQVVLNPLIEFEIQDLKEGNKKQEEEQFKKKWKKQLEIGDRFFSPNLSKKNTFLSIDV